MWRNAVLVIAMLAMCTATAHAVSGLHSQRLPSEFSLTDLKLRSDGVQTESLSAQFPSSQLVTMNIEGQAVELELTLNTDLISPKYRAYRQQPDGSMLALTAEESGVVNCYYRGSVRGQPGSAAAMSLCGAAVGAVRLGDGRVMAVEPRDTALFATGQGSHVVFDVNSLPDAGERHCGVGDDITEQDARSHSHSHSIAQQLEEAAHTAQQRARMDVLATPADTYVEVFVANDQLRVSAEGGTSNAESNALSLFNSADVLYSSLSTPTITLIVLGQVSWTSDPISSTTDSSALLNAWLTWSNANEIGQDNAILLSGRDFDGSTVGLAWVGTMCSSTHSNSIVQTLSMTSAEAAVIIAHEMGHNFGCSHDSQSNACSSSGTIMAPFLNGAATAWSTCSQDEIDDGFLNDAQSCLYNTTAQGTACGLPIALPVSDGASVQASVDLEAGVSTWYKVTSDTRQLLSVDTCAFSGNTNIKYYSDCSTLVSSDSNSCGGSQALFSGAEVEAGGAIYFEITLASGTESALVDFTGTGSHSTSCSTDSDCASGFCSLPDGECRYCGTPLQSDGSGTCAGFVASTTECDSNCETALDKCVDHEYNTVASSVCTNMGQSVGTATCADTSCVGTRVVVVLTMDCSTFNNVADLISEIGRVIQEVTGLSASEIVFQSHSCASVTASYNLATTSSSVSSSDLQNAISAVSPASVSVSSTDSSSSDSSNTTIIVIVVVAVVLLIVLGVGYYCYRKRRNAQQPGANAAGNGLPYTIPQTNNNFQQARVQQQPQAYNNNATRPTAPPRPVRSAVAPPAQGSSGRPHPGAQPFPARRCRILQQQPNGGVVMHEGIVHVDRYHGLVRLSAQSTTNEITFNQSARVVPGKSAPVYRSDAVQQIPDGQCVSIVMPNMQINLVMASKFLCDRLAFEVAESLRSVSSDQARRGSSIRVFQPDATQPATVAAPAPERSQPPPLPARTVVQPPQTRSLPPAPSAGQRSAPPPRPAQPSTRPAGMRSDAPWAQHLRRASQSNLNAGR